MHYLFLQNNVFEWLEATEVEMEQPYWTSIHDSLADGIQFVSNHVGLTESTKRSPQRPTKKKPRFFCVLDMQIQISIRQPHQPIPPPLPPGHRPRPPSDLTILFTTTISSASYSTSTTTSSG